MPPTYPPPEVSAAARDAIGTIINRSVSDPISLRQLKEYLSGTDDWGPHYLPTDDDSSPVQTPPLFFLAAMREVVPQSLLDLDGQHRSLGTPGVTGRSVEGGDDVEFIAPVYIGDTITCEERLVSIDTKEGRSGMLVIVITESEYRNQHHALVARRNYTVIFR